MNQAQREFLIFLDPKDLLSSKEKQELLLNSEIATYDKNSHLVMTGDEVHFALYLFDGIVRYYVVTEDGQEVTKAFYMDSFLIGSFDVTFNNIPSKFSVQALSSVRVLKIPLNNIRNLIEKSHNFCKVYNAFIVSVFVFKEKREIELLSTTARERMAKFNEEFPQIANEISNITLASYLGITPVQLSRIKNIKTVTTS